MVSPDGLARDDEEASVIRNSSSSAAPWALVVSDDPEFWLRLREGIPDCAQRLLPVRTGRDCLRMIEDRNIRIAVLDGRLPDVAGLHLTHLARRIRPDIGLLLVVDRTEAQEEREAREDGVLFYGAREGWREIVNVLRQTLECEKAKARTEQLAATHESVAPGKGGGGRG